MFCEELCTNSCPQVCIIQEMLMQSNLWKFRIPLEAHLVRRLSVTLPKLCNPKTKKEEKKIRGATVKYLEINTDFKRE